MSLFELKFSNASDFETNFSQRVRFLFKSFTARQILDLRKHNALDFEYKTFRHVRFWKNFCIRKTTFGFILFRENDMFCFFRAFSKSMFLNWKFHYVPDFDLKKVQGVRLWVKTSTNCKILKQTIKHASAFDLKISQRASFWVYLLQLAIFSCVH